MRKLIGLAATLAMALMTSPLMADTIFSVATGVGGDGPESATAKITTGTNSLTVVLSNLIANPTGAGQEVSGIFITLANAPTSVSLSSDSGTTIDIASGGVVTPDGAITNWGTSLTGSTICLETAGNCAGAGTPMFMIIGPGPYTNANSSIINHNPQIQGTGTFNLMALGITSSTQISSVTFEFGTGPDNSLGGVPEPSSILLLGTGLSGAAWIRRRSLSPR